MTATRVAIVGTGWWGGHHLRAFAAARDVEVVALCARDPEKTARKAARAGVAAYTDVDRMLEEARPDLVSICLPNQAHFEPTLHLLQASDVPLLVEKPLVFDLAEADELLAAAGPDRFFAICFNHRYSRAVRMAEEAVDSGRLGDVVLATWRFGGEGSSEHPHANLVETQCHGFDQLEQLAGPVTSLSAAFADRAPGTVAVTLSFEAGAVGSLVGSYDDSYGHAGAHALEVVGTAGRVLVEDTVRRFTFTAHGSETSEVWEPGYFNDRDRQFALTLDAYVADLVRALRAGEPPPVPAAAGRRALQLAHAAIESAATGHRIEVADSHARGG